MKDGSAIDLQDWLKLHQWVDSGGQAKAVIQGGEVRVNGEVETRRRRKLHPGDTVSLAGRDGIVTLGPA